MEISGSPILKEVKLVYLSQEFLHLVDPPAQTSPTVSSMLASSFPFSHLVMVCGNLSGHPLQSLSWCEDRIINLLNYYKDFKMRLFFTHEQPLLPNSCERICQHP